MESEITLCFAGNHDALDDARLQDLEFTDNNNMEKRIDLEVSRPPTKATAEVETEAAGKMHHSAKKVSDRSYAVVSLV